MQRRGCLWSAVLVGCALVVGPAWAQYRCDADGRALSETAPPVDRGHIFCGEVSGNRAKGFHARPGGVDPDTVRRTRIVEDAQPAGVYLLRNFLITEWSRTRTKSLSTMFPDHCSADEVIDAVVHAYAHRYLSRDNEFRGPSGPACRDSLGRPFTIRGFTSRRGRFHVRTAYPY